MSVQVGVGYVDIKPDLSGFSRDLKAGVNRDMTKVGQEAGRSLKTSLSTAVKGAAIGAGVASVAKFLGDAVQLASEMNEVGSTARQVFGGMATDMDRWAKGAADNLGLSRRSALESASGLGNLFSQVGFDEKTVADMSQRIVQAGVDLRSAFGGDTTAVLDSISAAFRGEYDSLQRVIPLISAAAVEKEALAKTGKKSASSLTAQEKAAATYSFILKNMGAAEGDRARTADSLANQQESMTAKWEDAKVALGEGLMPAMVGLAGVINDHLIPAFKTLFTSSGDATGWAATINNVVRDTLGFLVGVLQQTLRLMANVFENIPGGWGEDQAAQIRVAADSADGLRANLHASKEEMLASKGAGDELAKATKASTAANVGFTKSLTESNKATRDAAASERDLADAKKDLAELLRNGPVDEQKVADARRSLAEATRSAASANRSLADAQEEYDEAKAASDILGTDTAAETLEDAADGLADAQDGAASAAEREAEAQRELREAQAGDPEFQDKVAAARDRVADATDKVAASEQKVVDLAGPLVTATGQKTEAQRLLNEQLANTVRLTREQFDALMPLKQAEWERAREKEYGPVGGVGPTVVAPPGPSEVTPEEFATRTMGWGGAPASTKTVQVDMTVLGPAPDPVLLGKAIAWVL
jgi:hypothetical protein